MGEGPKISRQGRDARRPARGPRHGPAAQRRHRRQHRGPGADQRRQGRADQQLVNTRQPEVRHQRVPAPRRRLAVAAPGVVGRHGRRSPYYAPKGTKATAFSYWWPTDGRGPINNDTMAVAQGRQEPGARPPVPQPPARHQAGVLELQLHRLPAAAERDDAGGGGQEGLHRARTSTVDDHPRAAVQERLRAGPAQPGRARCCGRTPGRRSSRRERERGRQPRLLLAGVRRSRGSSGCCLFVVVPAYAVVAMAMGQVDLLLQPVPAWNPADWNPGCLSKAFSGVAPRRRVLAGGPQHARLRRGLAGPVLRDRLPGRLLRRAPRQALQDAADRAAGDPVLGQLPAADAGLDRPAVARRLRQQDAHRHRDRATRRTGSTATPTR